MLPVNEKPVPLKIESAAKKELRIEWRDGHQSVYTFRHIRQNCRCALCVQEWTREKTLDPESVPENLECSDIQMRGNYALSFVFSDGHTTGIYSFEHLRQLCLCADCTRAV